MLARTFQKRLMRTLMLILTIDFAMDSMSV